MQKPYAPSCDRNRDAILKVLKLYLKEEGTLLEVASGTGQHAVFFAEAFAYITWQCTDLAANLPGIQHWLDDGALRNTPKAAALDVNQAEWPATNCHAIFTANSLHIMSWESVQSFFDGVKNNLRSGGSLIVYGPFNYNGEYTSPSNQQFDQWLADRDPQSAIRDFEAVCALATAAGLSLINDHPMPANNRCIVWKKIV